MAYEEYCETQTQEEIANNDFCNESESGNIGSIFFTAQEFFDNSADAPQLGKQLYGYIGQWNLVHDTFTLQEHLSQMMLDGAPVSHIASILENRKSLSGYWRINFEDSADTPIPIDTKEELLAALGINDMREKTKKLKNDVVRELVFQEIEAYRETVLKQAPKEIYDRSYEIFCMERLRDYVCEIPCAFFGDEDEDQYDFSAKQLAKLEQLLQSRQFLLQLKYYSDCREDFNPMKIGDIEEVILDVLNEDYIGLNRIRRKYAD